MRRSLPLSPALLLSAVLLSMPTTAQDFAPFTPASRKLFGAVPGYESTFGITFDSTTVSGGTTTYHNYKTVWDTLTPSNCPWWGGPDCLKQDRPTWSGARIEATADGSHTLFNLWNEPITLAFSTEPGSQTLIYADADEQFLLNYVGEAPGNVLGLTENVRQWTILHQDLGGQAITSVLNNAPVEVGATVGLLRYFRIDSFPLVLQPVELVGQSEPPLGLHTITPAVLNDFQAGDEIQVHAVAHHYIGPPWLNYDIYTKRTVLSRTDTPTEVTYEMERVTYNVDSATEVTSTNTESYNKTDVFGSIPFDRFDGTQPTLRLEDYCGIPLWTWRTHLNTGLGYCPEENCWGPYDTNGPPPTGTTVHVGGLGIYSTSESIISPSGYSTSSNVVYFKKNGTECFQEVIMGSERITAQPPAFQLSPNPSAGMISISSDKPVTGAEVVDPQGHVVTDIVLDAQRGKLDMGVVPNGLYLVRLRFMDGSVGARHVVIGR